MPWQKAVASSAQDQQQRQQDSDFVVEDMTNYIAKIDHVSELCRLSPDEEYQLLVWLKDKIPTRLRYIETLKQANEDTPGTSRHMVIAPAANDIGGMIVFQELYQRAPQVQFRTSSSVMDFSYARPKTSKTGAKNLNVIMSWFDDELNGMQYDED